MRILKSYALLALILALSSTIAVADRIGTSLPVKIGTGSAVTTNVIFDIGSGSTNPEIQSTSAGVLKLSNDETNFVTVPSANDTMCVLAASQTLTNKTISGSSNTLTVLAGTQLSGQTPVANGGTGASSLTLNGVVVGNGTSAVQVTAADSNSSHFLAGGSPPSFSALPAASTSAAGTVSYEDSSTVSITFTGNSSSNSSGAQTINYARVGKKVTLTFPGITITATSGDTHLVGGSALPSRLWPVTTLFQPCGINVNGLALSAMGAMSIDTSGNVNIYKGFNQTDACTGSQSCGLYGGYSISYRVP